MHQRPSFDDIFRLYYEPLFHFAHRFLIDEEDCHDVVESAFETVWAHYDTLEFDNIRHYLYTVVRSRSIDFLRREAKQSRYAEYVRLVSDDTVSPDDAEDINEKLAIARHLLAEMGPPTSDILRACYVDGKKYREVAEDMGISVSTVKKHIVKALRHIRDYRTRRHNQTM